MHSIPTSAAGRSGPSIPCGKAKRRAGTGASRSWPPMPDSPTAKWSGNGSSSASKRRSTPFRDGLLAGSDPAAAGGMGLSGSIPLGANRGLPEMGHSQPRPRSADWRRRSAGRGATASAPATWTAGAVSGRTAISCPATPKVSRTRRTCHQHPHSALKTDPPADGSNATTARTLDVGTPSGYAFALATTLWRTRPPIRGR